jgi:hypothetical protein
MKHIRRLLVNSLACLSAGVCLAAIAIMFCPKLLWSKDFGANPLDVGIRYSVLVGDRAVSVLKSITSRKILIHRPGMSGSFTAVNYSEGEFLGFRFSSGDPQYTVWSSNRPVGVPVILGHDIWFDIPAWFIALISLPFPAWCFRFHSKIWLRWKRTVPQNVCQCCGYDLRATPYRCPECGTIPTVKNPPFATPPPYAIQ